MKKTLIIIGVYFVTPFVFGQPAENCQTENNRAFIKTELESLTGIYKSVLNDCNSKNPATGKTECEDELTNLKKNIEQLTALSSLVETLGCNYIISQDDKPCDNGKYCHSYKIEQQTGNSNPVAIDAEDAKRQYDLELKKVRSQNRQQFFELVFKIIGLLVENSNNSGILGEIKKIINGEANANERYTILNENQSYIETDGQRQGFKVNNPDGSTSFAIDTDGDGKPDHVTTYDKAGKVKSEKPLFKKRTKGITVSKPLSSQVAKGLSKPSPQLFNFYSDCITTLDVKGFVGVAKAWEKPTNEYLYIVGATVRDCGESKWNVLSPSADIGLHLYENNAQGKRLLPPDRNGKKAGRLFGPYNEGIDKDNGSQKYEWLDYCSMRYNNFAILDLTENPALDKIYILCQEGDDFPALEGGPDDVFRATISIDEIRKGNVIVTGNCDISGKCATLYFAIGTYNSDKGIFWDKYQPSRVPGTPLYYEPTIAVGKTVDYVKEHPYKSALIPTIPVSMLAYFESKATINAIYEGAQYIYNGTLRKALGAMNKKWVVISYADGFCIFNHVRGYRTMEDIVNTAIGNSGDCDWWAWPEGSGNVCLDSKKNANKLIKKHGKIKDIKWIDHPTKSCGK